MSGSPVFVGLDIGGTKIAALVVDDGGRELGRERRPTPAGPPEALLDGIAAAAGEALRQAGAPPDRVAAVGAGVPGQVEPDSGIVRLAVNLNLAAYPLGAALAAALGAPVRLENDVRLAGLGAYKHLRRAAAGEAAPDNLIYIGIGTGIAAGVILDGRIYRGMHGMAGEIGHIVVEPDGETCTCGQRGCLETIVSGPALLRRGAPTAGDAGEVYRRAAAGDPAAAAAVVRASGYLARTLCWLAMTFNVDQIVFGGGVTRSAEEFLTPVRAQLALLRTRSPLVEGVLAPLRLSLLPADFNPGAWGGVELARRLVLERS